MRDRKRLIVVGSRLREYREYALAALASRYEVALVTAAPVSWEAPYVTAVATADTTDPAALLAAVTGLLAESAEVPTGIYTWDEWSLTATAEVAAAVGLPHLSAAAAALCRDKYATRSALAAAGLSPVRYALAASEAEALAAAEGIGYPVVVKPRGLGGSLGVVVAADAAALREAYQVAAGAALPGVRSLAGVLVEEYLDGLEISVDSVVVDGVAEPVFVARKRLDFAPAFEEVGHLVGPWRHEPWADEVADLVRAAHQALGVELGVTHTELRLTAAGPRLVELNGRLGGDLIPRLGQLATGIDLALAAASLALGERPELAPTLQRWAEIRFLYPAYDGTVERVEPGAAATVPGIVDVVPLATSGTVLRLPPGMLTPRTAALLAVADDPRGCTAALDRAEAEVTVRMDGSPLDALGVVLENPVTRRFLAADRSLDAKVVHGVRGVDWFRYGAGGGEALNRPVFLAEGDRLRLEHDLDALFTLLTTIPDRLFGGDRRAFARAVGMTGTQTDLVLRGAGKRLPSMSRADMYREPGGFALMELNTGSSLGGWQMTEFGRALMYDREFLRFCDAEGLVHPDPLGSIAAVLRRECPGVADLPRPVLALTEWPDGFEKTKPWLDFVVPGWMRLGFDPIVCHLGEFEYRDGVPYVHGRRIDVVYRIFLPGEMADEQRSYDLVDPLLAAVDRGDTYLFAGLDCELYGNKGSLAMLSDERNRHAFSAEELALVQRILPWTRFVRDEKVWADGEQVDLLTYVLANQERLALKPTLLYGGVGVVPGWTVSAQEWQERVAAAVDGPYVVQRRVLPVAERFVDEAGTGLHEMVVAYGVMVVDGKYAGMLVRGTPDPQVGIVSMSNGAQIGCCFHVESAVAGGPDGRR